jgi:hypothetical protein
MHSYSSPLRKESAGPNRCEEVLVVVHSHQRNEKDGLPDSPWVIFRSIMPSSETRESNAFLTAIVAAILATIVLLAFAMYCLYMSCQTTTTTPTIVPKNDANGQLAATTTHHRRHSGRQHHRAKQRDEIPTPSESSSLGESVALEEASELTTSEIGRRDDTWSYAVVRTHGGSPSRRFLRWH